LTGSSTGYYKEPAFEVTVSAKKKLTPFSSVYSPDVYDRKPLPDDIFNSEGAILAYKGHTLSRDKLVKVFVYVDDVFRSGDIPDGPAGAGTPLMQETARPPAETPIQKALREKEEERYQPGFELTEEYEEDTAEKIEEYLTEIEFEPIPKIKTALRSNIHNVKEIYQKKIINNMTFLVSQNNEKITIQIAEYLTQILDTNLFASDYLDMVTAVRTKNNYVTFSHALATAFYTMAIAKKLKMLRDDYFNDHLGRWLPVKTRTNTRQPSPVPFSSQLLKYIDRQKNTILIKYDNDVKEVLFERIHDLMHEYAALDPRKKNYPSLSPAYDDSMLRTLTMAAVNCDIGKLCIPNRILNKQGALTEEEWEVMRHHPALAVSKLKEVNVNLPKMFAHIIGHHIINSTVGYPAVRGTIPPETRIITVSDIYDAMTAPRHYGKQHTNAQTLQYLKEMLDRGHIDLPLYLAAAHTFQEYNHEFVKRRHRKLVESETEENVR
jgi:HD-GYP domain-containing protein (c-di-GMP phosphodiesterase class II)